MLFVEWTPLSLNLFAGSKPCNLLNLPVKRGGIFSKCIYGISGIKTLLKPFLFLLLQKKAVSQSLS